MEPLDLSCKGPLSPPDSETSGTKSADKMVLEEHIINLLNKCGFPQLAQALQQSKTLRMSSRSSSFDGYPLTPSPDCPPFSPPVYSGYMLNPVNPPPLRYFDNQGQSSPLLRATVEHNYHRQDSSAAVSVIKSPQKKRPRIDSVGSSRIEELPPMAKNDWYFVSPHLAEEHQGMYMMVENHYKPRKDQYIAQKESQLPTEPEYNPNKSRLRKVYENQAEAEERERNNQASRKSRHKKKIANVMNDAHVKYDKAENDDIFILHNYLAEKLFQMEENMLTAGESALYMQDVRRHLGFYPQRTG